MAVYTRISAADLDTAIGRFGLALSHPPREVADGIENSTYFFHAIDTRGGQREYVLTILEAIPPSQMEFSAHLCLFLDGRGLPVPAPLLDADGHFSFALAGKSALVFPRAAGHHPGAPDEQHCGTLGDFMARAHRAPEDFHLRLGNGRGLDWLKSNRQVLKPHLSGPDLTLMDSEIDAYEALLALARPLPEGPIHADLFTDNCLFVGAQLSAVIDFYNACTDWLLLDLAIAANDWCCAPGSSELDTRRLDALTRRYGVLRPFSEEERSHWQDLLCLAATRFWVSRLMAVHVPELLGSGNIVQKDPEEYRRKLLARRAGVPALPIGTVR